MVRLYIIFSNAVVISINWNLFWMFWFKAKYYIGIFVGFKKHESVSCSRFINSRVSLDKNEKEENSSKNYLLFLLRHLSGITLLGIPAEIYMYGGQYYACLITTILVSIVVVYIYLPTFYNLEVKSSYEYLKIRFDNKIRTIALILFVISSLLYIPIVIFVPALAFNQGIF